MAVLLYAVWADAQPIIRSATETNAASTTSTVSLLSLKPQTNQVFSLTFGLDEVPAYQVKVMGRPLWQYMASVLYILLALVATYLIDLIFVKFLRKLAERTETKYDDLLIQLIHGPVKVIVFVIFLHIGLNVFGWPEWIETYISKGLKLVVAWSLTIMAMRLVDLFMEYLKDKASDQNRAFDTQLFSVIRKSLKVFLGLVAGLVTAQNLGFNITGLLASLSIGGLALGLAAQDTLSNLFGALVIFLDRPFNVGECIKIDSFDGVVEQIGLRSTRIRNLDGHLITVPNKTMGNATIVNITRRPNIRTVMDIGIIYETPPEKVKRATEILEQIYRQHPKTKDVLIGFNKFNDFSLNITVIHWWDGLDYKEYLAGMQELNLQILKKFNEEGIEFAYPTQLHYIKKAGE